MHPHGSYSAGVNSTRPLIGILAGLVLVEAGLQLTAPSSLESGTTRGMLLTFVFGVPVVLAAVLVSTRRRWAVMGTVMYGTIALALDLATLVQELSGQAGARWPVIVLTLVSSLGCFLLIVFGGRALLTTS